MTNQNLLHHDDMGHHAPANGQKARWQKHVVVTLWIAIAFLIILTIGLVLAETGGLLPSGSPNLSTPGWSIGWP